MIVIDCAKSKINLDVIANSGQCFRLNKFGEAEGAIGWRINKVNSFVDVVQRDNSLTFYCFKKDYYNIWSHYLDMDTDYSDSNIKEDKFLQLAYSYGKGMRILKQDFWETLVSFIISQNNNIPRIKKCILSLIEVYSKFPSAIDIITYPENVRNIGLGYRDAYLIDAAQQYSRLKQEIVNKRVSYDEYVKVLKQIKGVGDKVANCVALFSGHYLEACPVDVWMQRIIDEDYKGIKPDWMFSKKAGYLQQLAFYYKRSLGK